MYKNSVRNNPTPSPPLVNTPSTSLNPPMLPASSTSCPSLVTDFSFFNTFNSSFSFKNASALASYLAIVASSGLISTTPSNASNAKVSPVLHASHTPGHPTTAGISNELAMIAE